MEALEQDESEKPIIKSVSRSLNLAIVNSQLQGFELMMTSTWSENAIVSAAEKSALAAIFETEIKSRVFSFMFDVFATPGTLFSALVKAADEFCLPAASSSATSVKINDGFEYLVHTGRRDALAIVFSAGDAEVGGLPLTRDGEFVSTLEQLEYDYIVVKDTKRQRYLRVGSSGRVGCPCGAYLASYSEEYSRVVMLGFCTGGCAVLMLSHLADACFAFAPSFAVQPRFRDFLFLSPEGVPTVTLPQLYSKCALRHRKLRLHCLPPAFVPLNQSQLEIHQCLLRESICKRKQGLRVCIYLASQDVEVNHVFHALGDELLHHYTIHVIDEGHFGLMQKLDTDGTIKLLLERALYA
jgi:hypothetical protein